MLGKELVGTLAKNPVTHVSLPLYPALFVEADNGTGFVMSFQLMHHMIIGH